MGEIHVTIIEPFLIKNILTASNIHKIIDSYSYYLSTNELAKIPANLLKKYRGNGHFTAEFIDQHAKDLNWKNSSIYKYLTSDLIRKYNKKINWEYLSSYTTLDEEIMIEFQNQLNWRIVCEKQLLTPRVYAEASKRIDWYYASELQPLTEAVIDQNLSKINWMGFSYNKYLTIDIILKYWGKFNPYGLFDRFSIEKTIKRRDVKPISKLFPPPIIIDYDLLIDALITEGIFPEVKYNEKFTIIPKTPINDDTAAKLLGRIDFDHLIENGLLSDKFLISVLPKFKGSHWKIISEHQQLTESFILEYASSLDWDKVIAHQKISPSLEESIKSYLTSPKLLKRYLTLHKVSSALSNDLVGKVDWLTISKYGNLSEEFIDTYHNELDWRFLVRYQTLTESLITKYSEKIRWKLACRHQLLSEAILRKFSDQLNWPRVSQFQELSESFMTDFAKQLKWDVMSQWQNLSEKLILDNAAKVNWEFIARFQSLSNSFIDQHLDQLSLLQLSRNPNVDALHIQQIREKNSKLLQENYDQINLFSALQNLVVSEDFIEQHWEDISGFSFHLSKSQSLSESFLLKHLDHFTDLNEGDIFQINLSEEFYLSYLDSGRSIRLSKYGNQAVILPESVLTYALSLNKSLIGHTDVYQVLDRIKYSWKELRYYEHQFSQHENYFYDAEFFEDIIEYFNWKSSFKVKDIIDLVEDYPEYIRWDVVSSQKEIPIEFIRKYKDYLFWDEVCSHSKLTLDLIYELIDILQPAKLKSSGFYSEKELKEIEKAKKEFVPNIKIPSTVDDFKEILRRASNKPSVASNPAIPLSAVDDEDYDEDDEDSSWDHEYSYSLGMMFIETEMLQQTDISKLVELNGEAGYYNKLAFTKLGTDNNVPPVKYFINSSIQAIQPHQVVDFDWTKATDISQIKVQYVYWSTGQPIEGSKIYNGKFETMVIPEHLPLNYRLIVGGNRISVKQVESTKVSNEILNKSINELSISAKLKAELMDWAGLRTVGELLQASEEKIQSIKGLSSKTTKTYTELESAMIELGLGLRKPIAYVKPSQISSMDIQQAVKESNGVIANEIDWVEFLNYHQEDSISIVKIHSSELKKHKVYDLFSLDGIADVHRFHKSENDKILEFLEVYQSPDFIFVPIYIAED